MDDFDNFFNQNNGNNDAPRTPIYHTPSPKGDGGKANRSTIIAICVAVFMCLVVIVNVTVLAALKEEIATEYANSIATEMNKQYRAAVESALSQTDIVNAVTKAATEKASSEITKTVNEIVSEKYIKYVCVVNCSTPTTATHDGSAGTASGFVIGNKDKLYVVTNAHVVMTALTANNGRSLYTTDYMVAHEDITCNFEKSGDNTTYRLKVVAYGSLEESFTVYSGSGFFQQGQTVTVKTNIGSYEQPDLAICEFVGSQPNFTANGSAPALSLATDDEVHIGDAIAVVGNPQGIGISMSTGVISKNSFQLSNWGAGSFIMTDAAINNGNSGGAILNRNGKVVGVVESKLVSTNIENMGFGVSSQSLIDFIDWANGYFPTLQNSPIIYSTF